LPWGCRGARLFDNFEKGAPVSRIEVGPFDVAFAVDLDFRAEFKARELLPPEETRVLGNLDHVDFREVTFYANGRDFDYPRQSFTEHSFWIPLSDFRYIGRAENISIRFDEDEELYALSDEDMDLINLFTKKLDFEYVKAGIEGQRQPPKK